MASERFSQIISPPLNSNLGRDQLWFNIIYEICAYKRHPRRDMHIFQLISFECLPCDNTNYHLSFEFKGHAFHGKGVVYCFFSLHDCVYGVQYNMSSCFVF